MSFRIGIIGIGGMGSAHAQAIKDGKVKGATLVAVADIDPEKLTIAKEKFGDDLQCFNSAEELFAAKCVDGITIATPHYFHPPLTIAGLEAGYHMLSEKPAGVYTQAVREVNEAADKSDKIYAIMLNQRTNRVHVKLKELIEKGYLGVIKRSNMLITNWYRSQSYYDMGGWRATWAGEGGGVLMNQCPHNLDLWQWFCGMPKRVRAFAHCGKWHDIEVEDDVTAYVEYEDGSTGVFITSTGDSPGTNRLEINGDKAKVVLEDGKLTLYQNQQPEREFIKEYKGGFGSPEVWKIDIPIGRMPNQEHCIVLEAWVDACENDDRTKLIAAGQEGIHSLTLANAMMLSAWTDDWVDLPLDEDLYKKLLDEKVKNSTFVKEVKDIGIADTTGTY